MNNKKFSLIIIIPLFAITFVNSRTIYVGSDLQIKTLQSASAIAGPGDIIIIKNGTYLNRENIVNLNGEPDNPIIIHAEDEGKVIYSGQSEAWHLSSCSYLFIIGIVFEKQTANGVNIDDSGNVYGSAHNITIKNCTFHNINATGNNDLLKISGLEYFLIENCIFSNGAAGGSGIDMVGCHRGKIIGNNFENLGSSGIQAKGGTQFINILQNTFTDAGNRTINLGGSTGLAYFRPPDAKFEAANILVQSNVFIGSWSPIAYVGCTNVKVVNNTIYRPINWVFRILQETVDTSRFVSCGNNEFSNNIIYFGNGLNRIVNIGPNTAPETFTFSNNLWFNYEDDNFSNPQLPQNESNGIIQKDPLFIDPDRYNFELLANSPAKGKAIKTDNDVPDFQNRYFNTSPSIGAMESTGIYKDFTGNIDDKWYYNFDLGYKRNTIVQKLIKNSAETSELENFIHVGDASGNGSKIYISTINRKTSVSFENHDYPDLYDFSLLKGDTLNKYFNEPDYMSFIDSVKYEYIAGQVRKVLFTHHIGNVKELDVNLFFGNPGKLIEGIFSVNGYLLGKPNRAITLYDSTNLRCFIFKDIYGVENIWKFIDAECDKVEVSVDKYSDNKYIIYPNPSNNLINIEFETAATGIVEMSDLHCKIILANKINSEKHIKLDVSTYHSGLYFLKYKGAKTGFVKKIILTK